VRIKACWLRIDSQLSFLRDIASTLVPEHLQIHREIVQVLSVKLEISISKLEALTKPSKEEVPHPGEPQQGREVRRWKYALFKENLDLSIADLEAWQRIFDPSWYLALKITRNKTASLNLDQELAKRPESVNPDMNSSSKELRLSLTSSTPSAPIFLPEHGLNITPSSTVPHSSIKTAQRQTESPKSDQCYIIETFDCPPNVDRKLMTRNVRNFASKLAQAEPDSFGLLRCKGVIPHCPDESRVPSSFTFVYWMPNGMDQPISLRSRLIEGQKDHSLSERFRLASELAKSVSFVHMYDFVHKNIRPETVVLLQSSASLLGSAFLVGFENVRTAEGITARLGDDSWQRDLYRHPRRRGQAPEDDYIMQHDIYSLGVCLLEIGLWRSFVVQDDGGEFVPSAALHSSAPGPNSDVEQVQGDGLKDQLVALASSELPKWMGTSYSEIVRTCLTCLDPDNVDFGDEREFEDEDGIVVGVRFIQKVRLRHNWFASL
jgi:hypothetical protein